MARGDARGQRGGRGGGGGRGGDRTAVVSARGGVAKASGRGRGRGGSAAPAGKNTSRGRGGRGERGGRGGKGGKGRSSEKPRTAEQLDEEMNAYFMKDAKVGKAKLDDDLDDYFAQKDKKAAEKAAEAAPVADTMVEAETETVAS